MVSVPAWVKTALDENVYQEANIAVTLSDSSTMTITNADILIGGMSIDRYSESGDTLSMGSAIAAELDLKLNNHDGRFDDVDFYDARMDVGVLVRNPTTPTTTYTIKCGIFYVTSDERNVGEISLVALDGLIKADTAVDMFLSPCFSSFGLSVNCMPYRRSVVITACGSTNGLP